MSDIWKDCLEVGRNRRTCAGMDAAMKRIAELEAIMEEAIDGLNYCPSCHDTWTPAEQVCHCGWPNLRRGGE